MSWKEWQYNELQQAGVDYSTLEEVARYDSRMQELRDIKAEINSLMKAVAPTKESRILEIGTGTGEFALALAELCHSVLAVDVSDMMLDFAGKKAKERQVENVEFCHAGFLSFDYSRGPFHIIFSQLALHHLPDFWKFVALKKIFNALETGGQFFLKDVVFPSTIENYDFFFDGIIESVKNSSAAEFTKEYIVHIREEFSTLDWIMEDLLKKAGFTILEANTENEIIYNYLCSK
jgi:putative AdoMet-dependent methyltransferase